jgi:TIR domain
VLNEVSFSGDFNLNGETAGQGWWRIPLKLRPLNCLNAGADGFHRIATALLECVELLPRQRRVFVSYRRDNGREAALQLFDELSSSLFDVFLDTHGIAPAEDFQTVLWHRLCDSDVLVMLDTPDYFESRWTSAEFGRALASFSHVELPEVGEIGCCLSRRNSSRAHSGSKQAADTGLAVDRRPAESWEQPV